MYMDRVSAIKIYYYYYYIDVHTDTFIHIYYLFSGQLKLSIKQCTDKLIVHGKL